MLLRKTAVGVGAATTLTDAGSELDRTIFNTCVFMADEGMLGASTVAITVWCLCPLETEIKEEPPSFKKLVKRLS